MEPDIYERFAALHRIQNQMNEWLHYEFVDADEEQGVYTFRCMTEAWMCNPMGTLHGGISATILDHAMGSLAYCLKPGEGIAPAIQLQVNYHRPLAPAKSVLVRVWTVSITKTLMNFRAEACLEENPNKLCISGTGAYFYKEMHFGTSESAQKK